MTPLEMLYANYGHGANLRKIAAHPPVLGHGPDKPLAVLAGEAPGATEVVTGCPFSGAAGQRLTTHLGAFRDQCWVTNIVKYRPTAEQESRAGLKLRDRPPSVAEIAESMPYFWRELSFAAAPSTRAICAMGRVAASAILGADIRIGDVHGQWINRPIEDPGGEKWLVYVTYHPAAALHDPDKDEVLGEDLRRFAEDVQRDGDKLKRLVDVL